MTLSWGSPDCCWQGSWSPSCCWGENSYCIFPSERDWRFLSGGWCNERRGYPPPWQEATETHYLTQQTPLHTNTLIQDWWQDSFQLLIPRIYGHMKRVVYQLIKVTFLVHWPPHCWRSALSWKRLRWPWPLLGCCGAGRLRPSDSDTSLYMMRPLPLPDTLIRQWKVDNIFGSGQFVIILTLANNVKPSNITQIWKGKGAKY